LDVDVEKEYYLTNLLSYYKEKTKNILTPGTLKNYGTTKGYLFKFLDEKYGKEDSRLEDINGKFVFEFEHYLRMYKPEDHHKPLNNNDVMKHRERFKKLINLAIKIEWLEHNPFRNFKPKFDKVERDFLPEKELQNVEAKEFETDRLEKSIDSNLLKNINYHMNCFIQSEKGATYRQYLYCKTFFNQIHDLLHTKLNGFKLKKILIIKIIYLNFNVYSIYSYIANRIIRHYQSKTMYNEQLQSLRLFKKLINQAQTKPALEFNLGVESLKCSLSKWIEEEINFFKERRQLSIQFQEKSQL